MSEEIKNTPEEIEAVKAEDLEDTVEKENDAEIDGGIGRINFDIDGCKNDYKIKSDSKVKINSTTEENELLYKIKLDIDNGIGEISLNFR